MKKVIAIIILGVMMFGLFGCAKKNDYVSISQEEAREMMENENIVVLDVREPFEFDEGHIENAILLPLGDIEKKAEEVLADKNQTILVYCRSGNRSKQAAAKLAKLGYTAVFEMGGVIEWTKNGFPLVK